MLGKGEIENSLDNVALAFAQVTDDYETRKMDEFGRSPFFSGKKCSSYLASQWILKED
jgi:hypothetical protein